MYATREYHTQHTSASPEALLSLARAVHQCNMAQSFGALFTQALTRTNVHTLDELKATEKLELSNVHNSQSSGFAHINGHTPPKGTSHLELEQSTVRSGCEHAP
jgi:hypothetical protein